MVVLMEFTKLFTMELPLVSDQLDWAAKVEHSGVGVRLKLHQMTLNPVMLGKEVILQVILRLSST